MTKERIHLSIFFLVVLLSFVVLPICIYGLDGYLLWMPIVSEFLKGTANYKFSPVIFGGQNLLAIYGDLPFWYVGRWLSLSPMVTLNLTHFVWLILAGIPSLVIYRGISKQRASNDVYLITLYCFLSPIVVNRLYAGHFNLLYGMLPFLIGVSLLFLNSVPYLIFSVFTIWCAFSIQSYQLIAYHIFYLPLFFVLLKQYSERPQKDLLRIAAVMIGGILLAGPNLMAMLEHARDPENLRASAGNVVYSYLTSAPRDIFQLFFGSQNKLTNVDRFMYFHELNYAMGLFLLWPFWRKLERPIRITFLMMLIIFFGFSMNLPGFNLLGDIPLISLFRVPQRSFMIIAFFLPLYILAKISPKISRLELGILLLVTLVSSFLNLELFVILVLAILGLMKLGKVYSPPDGIFTKLVLTALLVSSADKWTPIVDTEKKFSSALTQLTSVKKQIAPAEREQKLFYFLSPDPLVFNAAANYLGFRTIEGYGHPPKDIFRRMEVLTGQEISPTMNQLIFPRSQLIGFALKEFNIDTVVTLRGPGNIRIIPVNRER